jgi:hypothetical protein
MQDPYPLAYMTHTQHSIRQAYTALILDTRTQKKDGTFPMKLRITFNRKQKYYLTGKDLTILEYERVLAKSPAKNTKTSAVSAVN